MLISLQDSNVFIIIQYLQAYKDCTVYYMTRQSPWMHTVNPQLILIKYNLRTRVDELIGV